MIAYLLIHALILIYPCVHTYVSTIHANLFTYPYSHSNLSCWYPNLSMLAFLLIHAHIFTHSCSYTYLFMLIFILIHARMLTYPCSHTYLFIFACFLIYARSSHNYLLMLTYLLILGHADKQTKIHALTLPIIQSTIYGNIIYIFWTYLFALQIHLSLFICYCLTSPLTAKAII